MPDDGTAGNTGPTGTPAGSGTGAASDQSQQGTQRFEKMLSDQQAMIGRQSTEIGDLRKERDALRQQLEQRGAVPAGSRPAPGQDTQQPAQSSPMTKTEEQYLETSWKGLRDEEKAALLKDAKGANLDEKLVSIRTDLLAEMRSQVQIVPSSLFAHDEPAAASPAAAQSESYRALLVKAIVGADRARHTMPVVPGSGTGSAFTPLRPGPIREEQSRPTAGDGGVLSLTRAKTGGK